MGEGFVPIDWERVDPKFAAWREFWSEPWVLKDPITLASLMPPRVLTTTSAYTDAPGPVFPGAKYKRPDAVMGDDGQWHPLPKEPDHGEG
jgi:hypothetical protein